MLRRQFISYASQASLMAGVSRFACAQTNQPKLMLYSGWNTKNIGDQGHTPGTLRYLDSHFPEAKISLWLSSTNDETVAMLKNRFPNITIVRGSINREAKADHPDLQAAFDEADLFIQNSGMSYNAFWNPPHILETCNTHNKPICLYAQSFDGLREEDKDHMIKQLSQAAAIYCRDNESYYFLRGIGVNSPILEFGPDGCFGIDLLNDKKAFSFMDQHGLESKKFLVVIIRTNSSASKKPSGTSGNRLNPADPTSDEERQNELWASKLRGIITHWVNETGLKVMLAPEVEKEIVHSKRLLYDRLPSDIQAKVVHKAEWWNMDEASSIYKQAHTVVSMEPHSLIMSLAHRTPVIHLFSKKHGFKAWMFRDIGLPEWLYNIDEVPVQRPIKALMDIHSNYNRAVTKVDRAITFVEQRSKEMVHDIKSIVV